MSVSAPSPLSPSSAEPSEPSEPAPAGQPSVPWSPLGAVLAVGFLVILLAMVLPVVWRSGEVGVIAHAIGFLVTGGVVVGGIIYASTLAG